MKKRIFSLVLALAMMVSVSTAFADIGFDTNADADVFYEGNKPFELIEKILIELNDDMAAQIFDKGEHENQYAEIESVNVTSIDGTLTWYINNYLGEEATYKRQYLVALVKAYGTEGANNSVDTNAAALKNGLKNLGNDTTSKSMRESYGMLTAYVEEMKTLFANETYGISAVNYTGQVVEDSKWYIAEPLKLILEVIFANNKTEMRNKYFEFLQNDRAKKTLAVLFGAKLTGEIVNDTFLPGSETETIGIVHHLKNYLNGQGKLDEFLDSLSTVMVSDQIPVEEAFDVLGTHVSAAYSGNAELREDIEMLMGDGTNPGLIEKLVKDVDPTLEASNVWINLLISEFVQMNLYGTDANNISASSPNPAGITIANNTTVGYRLRNLGAYGIQSAPFRNGYVDVLCFNEDGTPNSFVTYDKATSTFTVQIDESKASEYKAYLKLYRGEADGQVDNFIESYPVTIVNYTRPSGGGSSKLYITYNTNGGQTIGSTAHTRGSVVQLNKVPVREGYIFTGWYSDAALTQKIDSVTVTASTTVYAGWKKDGSAVVSVVDIPELLEGEHHYAYIMGYPEGDVRPYGNITRAETVTMVFRLLKDNVRTSNLTETNSFNDVNESDWFNKAVSTLAAMGIVEGRTETEFMPNANITRAEFATIFARLAEFDAVAEQNYGDVDRHWAEEHIYEASSYGWIAGYEDDTFKPDKAINRAEAMTLVNRVLKRVPESKEDLLDGMTIWSDNRDTSAWYYLAVQEATNSHDHVMKNAAYEKWTVLTENKDWTVFEK